MTDIVRDVALTSNVLEKVGNFLQDKDIVAVTSQSALQDASSILSKCRDAFADIDDILHQGNSAELDGARRFSKRAILLWAHKGPRTELLKRRLESLKSSLLLLLLVLSLAKDKGGVANGYETLCLEESALISMVENLL